jgi:hypothetical protein
MMIIDEPETYILTIGGYPVLTPTGARHLETLESVNAELLAALEAVHDAFVRDGIAVRMDPNDSRLERAALVLQTVNRAIAKAKV